MSVLTVWAWILCGYKPACRLDISLLLATFSVPFTFALISSPEAQILANLNVLPWRY